MKSQVTLRKMSVFFKIIFESYKFIPKMVARNLFGLASAFHFKTKNCLENVTFHSRYYVIAKEIVFPFCS